MEVCIIDIVENKEIGIFESRNEAVKVMRKKYGFNITNNTIEKRLSSKLTKPYKERFMFYYADEKKQLNNKISHLKRRSIMQEHLQHKSLVDSIGSV